MDKEIVYGFAESKFGTIVVARTASGICDLQFLGYNKMEVIHELASHWGVYTPTTQDDMMADTVKRIIFDGYDHEIYIDLHGTEFQLKVWKEVMKVQKGETISYQELAERIGEPKAVRAVATAVAQNSIAMLVPCHRIIHKDGTLGEYHWGRELKKEILDWEENTDA